MWMEIEILTAIILVGLSLLMRVFDNSIMIHQPAYLGTTNPDRDPQIAALRISSLNDVQ